MPGNCNSRLSSTGKLLLIVACLVPSLRGAAQPPAIHVTEAALKHQVEQHPDDFGANSTLGEFYIESKNYRAAIPYLRAAYRLNPAVYNNAFDLAQAELQTGDFKSAGEIVRQSLSRQDRPELHNLLGDCEEAAANFHEAASQYQIAAQADPSEQNLFSFGSELLKYHGYREAGQVLSYAVERYPKSARLRVALGVAEYSLGDYRAAVETLCKAVDLDPTDTRALEFLGKMTGVAPELSSDVAARLKHFVTVYPSNPAANYYYAMSLLAAPVKAALAHGDDSPERYLERAVAASPSFAEAHYQLGILLEQQGYNSRARAEYESTIRLQPQLSGAHYRLAHLYRLAGKTALAQREYDAVRNLREH